ncbi:hypothetical protein GQ42DRAFT_116646 [Ramicandelaber brevisporus]|nr:hypothetical protein GQ42DRAFT_116646 [Ramicandelaber brevisporus]
MCLCCICLDSLHIGDSVRSLPCQHVYHTQCIDVWLGEHSTWCPHCKADVRPPEEIERAIERQQHWQQRRDEEQIQEQGQSQDGDHISVDMVQNAQMQAIALRSYQLSFGGGRLM